MKYNKKEKLTLVCGFCKQRNYDITLSLEIKNRKPLVQVNKYCPHCHKATSHDGNR